MTAIPPLRNGLPRVTYDPADRCITVLLGDDADPITLFVMGVDSGLTVEGRLTPALPSGARCLNVAVRRLEDGPVIVTVGPE